MHEFAIMSDVIQNVLSVAEKEDARKVTKIFLSVGELMMVTPESLRLAFEALAEDERIKGAELVVEMEKARMRCSRCGNETCSLPKDISHHHEAPVLRCEKCGCALDVLGGREVIVREIEIER